MTAQYPHYRHPRRRTADADDRCAVLLIAGVRISALRWDRRRPFDRRGLALSPPPPRYSVLHVCDHTNASSSKRIRQKITLSSLILRISSSEIPKVRRRSKKSIAACVPTPTARGARQGLTEGWATEHVVRFRKKYFLRRKIFLAEKNIFLAEKNLFLAEKYISCGKKNSCGKKYFLRKKIYFLRRKIYFLRKNIFLAEKIYFLRKKYISCGKKYFLRKKNISCGKIFLYHVTNKLP